MLTVKNEVMEIEAGWTVEITHIPIIAGVTVSVYDGQNAALRINGVTIIEFRWTAEAAQMVAGIDTAESIEVLELLQRLHIK